MAPGVLIFAGAPLSAALNWEESGLLDTFCEPIARFAGLDFNAGDRSFVPATAESTASDNPSWRSISLERQYLTTGLSQLHGYGKEYEGAGFFTASIIDSFIEELSQQPFGASQASSVESVEQVLSQFYEQSYAIYEDIPSSQIQTTAETDTSFYTNESSSYATSSDSYRGKEIPVAGHLTNLKDIPNAKYLDSIHPQTMTVNLIIGIISNPPPRTIKTRRGADVELIEVLAGDETKAGFGINFWLSSSQAVEGDMKNALSELRPQDVVLMRNVALSSFRGKVYGQSLRKEITKVHLLYRKRMDKTDVGGCYSTSDLTGGENAHPQVEKTRMVREWVQRFVGTGAGAAARKAKGRAFGEAGEALPPDTQ